MLRLVLVHPQVHLPVHHIAPRQLEFFPIFRIPAPDFRALSHQRISRLMNEVIWRLAPSPQEEQSVRLIFASLAKLLIATLAGLLIPGATYAQRAPVVESVDVRVPVAPTPVKIDGKTILAYELRIANFLGSDAVLKRIVISDKNRSDVPLADYR